MNRFLQLDNRGIVVPTKSTIQSAGQVIPYHKNNPILHKIDKLRNGGVPRICITRKQGGIGDVLMTTPVVKSIALKYGIQVDYGTDFGYLEGALPKVLQYNPFINKIIPWDKVEVDDYDAVIDLTCPCIAHEKPLALPINRIDLFARHIQIKLIDTNLNYYITEEEKKWAINYLDEYNLYNKITILVQPFANAGPRCAPPDLLKKVLAGLIQCNKNIRPIIITHSTDTTKLDWNFGNIHVINNFSIRQIAAILAECKLVICPDSSILHLAAALHHTTFTLFGPTDPRARVNYHPEAIAYWPAKRLKNYPIWYGPSVDNYLCWKLMEVPVIIKSVLSMLNKTLLPPVDDFITYGTYSQEEEYYEII
jgi:ADP-heptose:LPS heptosyltransferase